MGKYDKVMAELPRVEKPFQDDSHATRILEEMRELENSPEFKRQAAWLFERYAYKRREKARIQAELSACETELEAVQRLMQEQFEVEGIEGMNLNGDKVRLEPGINVKVVDREEFRQWCLDDPDLAPQMQLHSSTAQSLVRKMLLAGHAEPPGTVAVVWDKVVFTPGE